MDKKPKFTQEPLKKSLDQNKENPAEWPHATHPVTGEKVPYVQTDRGALYPVAMLGGLPGAHRPTNCDIDITIHICNSLQHGAYITSACEAAGIPAQKYYEWLNHAERDEKQGKKPGFKGKPMESPYIAFRDSVKIAYYQAENNLLEKLHNGEDDKTWQRLAWILERTRQDRFGQRQQIEHSVTVSGPSVPQESPQTHEQWLAMVERERKALQESAQDTDYKDITDTSTDTDTDTDT